MDKLDIDIEIQEELNKLAKDMTDNQVAFCIEYIKEYNATQSYLAVYKNVKNENTAGVNASRLLRNARVRRYVALLNKQIQNKGVASAYEVKQFFTDMMNDKGVGNTDRIRAGENLAKMHSLFVDKLEIEHKGEINHRPFSDMETSEIREYLDELKEE